MAFAAYGPRVHAGGDVSKRRNLTNSVDFLRRGCWWRQFLCNGQNGDPPSTLSVVNLGTTPIAPAPYHAPDIRTTYRQKYADNKRA